MELIKNILPQYPDIELPSKLSVVRFPTPVITESIAGSGEPIMFLHPIHGTFDCEKAILRTLSHFKALSDLQITLIKMNDADFKKGTLQSDYTFWIEEAFRYHEKNGVLCALLPAQTEPKLTNGNRGYARTTEAEVTRILDKLSADHHDRIIKATLMLQKGYEGLRYIEDLIHHHAPSFPHFTNIQATIRFALGLSLNNQGHSKIRNVVIKQQEDHHIEIPA